MNTINEGPVWTNNYGKNYQTLIDSILCRVSQYDDGHWYWEAGYYNDAGELVIQSGIEAEREPAEFIALDWAGRGKRAILDADLDELEDKLEQTMDRIIALDRDRASRITAGYRSGYKDGQTRLRDAILGLIDPPSGYEPEQAASDMDIIDIPAFLRKHGDEVQA